MRAVKQVSIPKIGLVIVSAICMGFFTVFVYFNKPDPNTQFLAKNCTPNTVCFYPDKSMGWCNKDRICQEVNTICYPEKSPPPGIVTLMPMPDPNNWSVLCIPCDEVKCMKSLGPFMNSHGAVCVYTVSSAGTNCSSDYTHITGICNGTTTCTYLNITSLQNSTGTYACYHEKQGTCVYNSGNNL